MDTFLCAGVDWLLCTQLTDGAKGGRFGDKRAPVSANNKKTFKKKNNLSAKGVAFFGHLLIGLIV